MIRSLVQIRPGAQVGGIIGNKSGSAPGQWGFDTPPIHKFLNNLEVKTKKDLKNSAKRKKQLDPDVEVRLAIRKREVSKRIRAIIEGSGKTLSEIEDSSGVKIAYLSRVQQGENLTLESICRLELALDREIITISMSDKPMNLTVIGSGDGMRITQPPPLKRKK
jgi:hypothetical protein